MAERLLFLLLLPCKVLVKIWLIINRAMLLNTDIYLRPAEECNGNRCVLINYGMIKG